MREEPPDLSGHMNMICAALGFADKAQVAELRLTSREATILYYVLDNDGAKWIDKDGPVTRWLKLKVTT